MKTYLLKLRKGKRSCLKRLPLLLVLCLALLSTGLSLGAPGSPSPDNHDFVWARNMGGTEADLGESIFIDQAGSIYTTGSFNGTADFDPGTGVFDIPSAGEDDIFVSKLDSSGHFVWAKSMGGESEDIGKDIFVDDSGYVYTTGHFWETADFDPGAGVVTLSSAGEPDIFVSKLDSNGNFIWARAMGGTNLDFGTAIFVDAYGCVYTAGYFYGTADFNPHEEGIFNLTSAGQSDIFISKLDSSGDFVWALAIGSTGYDGALSLYLDGSQYVYATGFFQDTVDFNPTSGTYELTSAGQNDIFVSKFASTGDFYGAWSMGGTDVDAGYSLFVDSEHHVYVTGSFKGSADFNPGSTSYNLTSAGEQDIFLSKLTGAGDFIWARAMGGGEDDIGRGISVDALGNVYTTGDFYSTADFNPGEEVYELTSAGNNDIFVSKLDILGNMAWAVSMGGSDFDKGNSIVVDGSDFVYTTGYFYQSADFDPAPAVHNLSSAGSYDIFISKLGKIHTLFLPLVTRNLSP